MLFHMKLGQVTIHTYFFGEEDLGSLGSLCGDESSDLCLFTLAFSLNKLAFVSLLLELKDTYKRIRLSLVEKRNTQ